MLLYKNDRFYARYISFILPDGCYLDPNPPITNDYGISAWSEENQLRIDISEETPPRSGEIAQAMHSYFFEGDDAFEQDSPIREINLDGITGYEVLYHSGADYYEVWLSLPDGLICEFFAECPMGTVENIKELPVIQTFLRNIKKEY